MDLETVEYDDIPMFSFDGLNVEAKVVDVYDGDTCTIVFFFKGEPIKVRCRLMGINAPEMRPSRNMEDREEYIQQAVRARNRFIQLLVPESTLDTDYSRDQIRELLRQSRSVRCRLGEFDKYGRVLISISVEDGGVGETLLREGLCKAYSV